MGPDGLLVECRRPTWRTYPLTVGAGVAVRRRTCPKLRRRVEVKAQELAVAVVAVGPRDFTRPVLLLRPLVGLAVAYQLWGKLIYGRS